MPADAKFGTELNSKRFGRTEKTGWYFCLIMTISTLTGSSIFEHLKQLGYQYEIEYFGDSTIRESRKPLFDTSKPLTDKGYFACMRYAAVLILDIPEWDRICPTWLKAMNDFRLQRLERNVYYWRRRALKDEYKAFVAFPSPYTPSFDLLPHVADVACFPPFRDIIKAPEGTPMNDKLFESAFAQLPEFVDEWKKWLDAEVAEMVQIPSHLSLKDTSSGQISTSSNTVVPESSKGPADKLRLACALFRGRSPGIFTYPDVFLSCKDISYPSRGETDSGRTGSVWDRYGIKYVGEAPYVVHACGLDPTLATEQDMERRDARLKCLCCGWSGSWGWREAVRLPFCGVRQSMALSMDVALSKIDIACLFTSCEPGTVATRR